jgi:preprotein translocase subunit SecG
LHVIACLILITVVLLQSGKEGMGVIFGGGSGSVFGSSGAGGLLTKVTAGAAAIFLATSLTYNVLTKPDRAPEGSLMDVQVEENRQQEQAPDFLDDIETGQGEQTGEVLIEQPAREEDEQQ